MPDSTGWWRSHPATRTRCARSCSTRSAPSSSPSSLTSARRSWRAWKPGPGRLSICRPSLRPVTSPTEQPGRRYFRPRAVCEIRTIQALGSALICSLPRCRSVSWRGARVNGPSRQGQRRLPRRALLAAALTLMLAACAPTTGSSPATAPAGAPTAGPASDAVPPTGQVAAGPTSGSADKAEEVSRQVDLMVSPGGRYDELLRAILVSVDGDLIAEHYSSTSGPDVTADVYSVTKSVMSMLIGIAIGEGLIDSVEKTVGELLPSHAAAMTPEAAAITLRQLLTMTGGLPGTPVGGFFDPFESTANWVDTILSSPLAQPPGQQFTYSNASSHLLSAILTEATGRPALDYAREKLFEPLGIGSQPAATPVPKPDRADVAAYDAARGFAWSVDPQGYELGYSNLKITAADMIKLGELYLNGGQWQGAQLLSAAWVAESTQPHVQPGADPSPGYGYQWWLDDAAGHPAFAAMGYAGQLIEVVPDLNLVVAVSCLDGPAAFNSTDLAALVSRHVGPAVSGGPG